MDIRIGDFKAGQNHIDAVTDVIKSGRITEGPKVAELEKVMAKYLGVKNAILVTNGTIALQLVSLYLRNKNKHDELNVMVPALTFPATINAFSSSGHPVGLCDIGEDLQMNIDTLSKTDKQLTNIVVPVHLMGYTADMTHIMSEAKKYDWTVIEDACEAFGAEHDGKKVGTIGDFGCFSFYVSHNITAGELGMIVTNNNEAAKVLRSMKNHGRVGSGMLFNHEYVGYNAKTTEFSAALGLENMKDVDTSLKIRKDNCKYFFDNIKNDKLSPYPVTEGFSPLGYPIGCKTEGLKNSVCELLNLAGIETRGIFPCLANQPCYKDFEHLKLPVANRIEKTVFYIGCHQYLSQEDKDRIIDVLNKV